MKRAAVFIATMLYSAGAQAAWSDVVTTFLSQIKDVPGAIDELIRVAVNTPIEVVSCQVKLDSLKDVQAPLLEIIASKTGLKNRLEAYVVSPSPERWSRMGNTVPLLLEDLHRLGQSAQDKARQFASSQELSDAFIDLAVSIKSRKIDILQELEAMPKPETADELKDVSSAATALGEEIERLRGVKDALAEELSKGC